MTPTTDGLLYDLVRATRAELPGCVRLRHRIHADPRLSGAEADTAGMVAEELGAGPGEPVADTGKVIRIGPEHGPAVALRAELDALPLVEETGVGHAATNGAMHACGHDIHLAATCALGRAAAALPSLPVALLVVLQPREETSPLGAPDVVRSGVLAQHRAQAVLGAHVQPEVAPGHVDVATGSVNAAADEFEITVTGEAGHAGYPHLTADPVLALAHAVVALQQVASRRSDPLHGVVVSVTQLDAGSGFNVIPGQARARGTVRVLDPEDRAAALKAVTEIVVHTATAHGCHGRVELFNGEPALINDDQLAATTRPVLARLGVSVTDGFRSCGADDFAYYGAVCPSLMMFVGTRSQTGSLPGLHHPAFYPPDSSVADVTRALLAGYVAASVLPDLPGGTE